MYKYNIINDSLDTTVIATYVRMYIRKYANYNFLYQSVI